MATRGLVKFKLHVHGQTKLSLLVSKSGNCASTVWIRHADIGKQLWLDGQTVELTISQRLAQIERLNR